MTIDMERAHSQAPDVIIDRIENEISIARDRFGHLASRMDIDWQGQSVMGTIAAYGQVCDFKVDVGDTMVSVMVDLPVTLALFKKKVVAMIDFRLDRICR